MKKIFLFILIIFQLCMLTGCWGARLVQSETIVTAIGIDFKDDEYTVYLQALNFSNIAKQEGGASLLEAPPRLIAQATGKSIASAINSLEQKASLPFYFGHVISVILSKNIIDEKLKSFNDFFSNRTLLRYNTWIYGTDEDIKEILLGESFFNLPAIYTVVESPQLKTRKNLMIPNLTYHEYISKFYDPVGTILIPSLTINKDNFEEDVKKNIANFNGAYVIFQKKGKGFISSEEMDGLKWLNQVTYTIPVNLIDQKVSAQIKNTSGNVKVISGKKPKYKISINAKAILTENEKGLSKKEIIKSLNAKIKSDVLNTIKKGEELKVDLLNISEKSYRYSNKWNVNTINEINEKSIEDIDVKVHIIQSQTYKR